MLLAELAYAKLPASELESASVHLGAEAACTKLGLPSKVSFATACLSLWLNSRQACVREIKAEETEEEDIPACLALWLIFCKKKKKKALSVLMSCLFKIV